MPCLPESSHCVLTRTPAFKKLAVIWRPKHHGANTPTCSACPYPLHSNANSCWTKFCAKDLIIEVGLEKSDVNAKMLSAGMAAACKSFKSMANHNTSSYDTINRLHWTNMAGKNRAQSWLGNLKEKFHQTWGEMTTVPWFTTTQTSQCVRAAKKKNISVAFPYIESFFVFDTDFLSTRQNVKKK